MTSPPLSADLAGLAERAAHGFRLRFGQAPTCLAAAPGRVNLIGEHTDYNGGFVLPVAIDRHTVLAAAPAAGGEGWTRIASEKFEGQALVRPGEPSTDLHPAWARYVAGVLFLAAASGREVGPMDIWIESTIPNGAGLSSSAAVEVAAATLVEQLSGRPFDPMDKVHLCRRAEHEYARVPCGIMDQAAVVLSIPGHALHIDCRALSFAQVPIDEQRIRLLVIDTHVKHALAQGAYAERLSQSRRAAELLGVETLREVTLEDLEGSCRALASRLRARVRHVVSENDRVGRMVAALRQNDWVEAGRIMYAGHESLKVDYEVSCAELDALVEAARTIGTAGGVFGCRMTGAGFGGCALALVAAERVDSILEGLSEVRLGTARGKPSFIVTASVGGARVLPDWNDWNPGSRP